jgi:hypothetical protein
LVLRNSLLLAQLLNIPADPPINLLQVLRLKSYAAFLHPAFKHPTTFERNNSMRQLIIGVLFLGLPGLAADKIVIPAGSKIYVDTNNGFDLFILAAFQVKHVNAQLVSAAEKADYVLDSSLFHSHEFAATEKAAGSYRVSEAAFKLTSKSGEIVWAYAATKGILSRGKQSVAEACAKHLKEIVGK